MPSLRIESGGRLVEQQDLGPVDERARDREPALHPTREGIDARVAAIAQLDELEQLRCPFADLRARKAPGDIVFISSAATLTHAANGGPYNMGKAAEEALALTLAKEELRNGIRVNIVAPGLVDTSMGQKLMKAVAGVDDLRALDASMPFGRVCQPEDVANVVAWVVGPGSSYVTGQKINVDGLATFMR